jgi:hypothetical protein
MISLESVKLSRSQRKQMQRAVDVRINGSVRLGRGN